MSTLRPQNAFREQQAAVHVQPCGGMRWRAIQHFKMPYNPFREISLTFPSRIKGLSPL